MYRLLQKEEMPSLAELPNDTNLINFSVLNDFSQKLKFRSFSIKYVFEGCEHYVVNDTNYYVGKGEYLLANSLCEGKVEIDSPNLVKGICIDVSPQLLSEAFGQYIAPDTPFPDIDADHFFRGEAFLENKYNSRHTNLGKVLDELGRKLNENPAEAYQFEQEFYFTLAEKIVEDHQPIITQLYNIQTMKHNTRKDLYRKVIRGKEFLENNLCNPISVGQAADYACLSEYHFFRLFKNAFGITPQQYLIRQRVSHAKILLHTGNFSVTEAATATGFSDVYSFSKTFKKHLGVSPSKATDFGLLRM